MKQEAAAMTNGSDLAVEIFARAFAGAAAVHHHGHDHTRAMGRVVAA